MTIPSSNTLSDQALQDLVYAVSHDLGASVRTIKGFSELLGRRYAESLDDEGKKFLSLMSQGATNLQAQLDGLLTFSRVTSRGQPLEPTSVSDVWQSVLSQSPVLPLATDVSIDTGILPIVFADAVQLAQLLGELLNNALKFRRDEPLRIEFSAVRWRDKFIVSDIAERQADSTRGQGRGLPNESDNKPPEMYPRADMSDYLLEFRDNGRGIAAHQQTRVFQMFQRGSADVPGIGAGLAIARRIVERHGGQIWLESDGHERTSFFFTLKSASDDSVSREPQADQTLAAAKFPPPFPL